MVQVLAQLDWTAISAASTAVTAIAAAIYTGFTIWLTLETRKLRLWQSNPRVILDVPKALQEGTHRFELKNIGGGTAFHVKVAFSHIARTAASRLELPQILERGLICLSPGESFPFTLNVNDAARAANVRAAVERAAAELGMTSESTDPHPQKSICVNWNDAFQGGKAHKMQFLFPPDSRYWNSTNASN